MLKVTAAQVTFYNFSKFCDTHLQITIDPTYKKYLNPFRKFSSSIFHEVKKVRIQTF